MEMAVVQTNPLSREEHEKMAEIYPALFKDSVYVRTNPGRCVLPNSYLEHKHCLKNWDHRSRDVYVCGFPKSGTTWIQDLVWCLQNNCDLESCKKVFVYARARYLDGLFQFYKVKQSWPDPLRSLIELPGMQMLPDPRVFKTHLPLCLYPDDLLDSSRVVVCFRNPKDVVVSYYHHEKMFKFHGFTHDFATYFDLFMDDMLPFCPYFDYYVEAWKKREHPNMCIVFYEDMKDDFAGGVRKVAKFLGKDLEDSEVDQLVWSLSFKQMKENTEGHWDKDALFADKEGNFFRKGTVGDYKEYFTDDMNRRMDEKIANFFKPIGLEFKFE